MRKRITTSLFLASLWLCSSQASALEPGERAPLFAAQALSGDAKLALAAYRGKVVYLDFWASWCAPCMKSLPLLEDLRGELANPDFQILAINVDKDPEKAREFLRDHPVSYPHATDPAGHLPQTYEIKTMPTSFVIDRDGIIRHIHHGFRAGDMDALRDQIVDLLGGQP